MTTEETVLLSRIKRETAAREAAIAALRSEIPKLDDTQALIKSLRTRLTNVNEIVTSQSVELENARAEIEEVSRVGVGERAALAEQITTLSATVTGIGDGLVVASARIEEVALAAATDQYALAQFSTDVRTRFASNDARFNEQVTLLTTADTALASRATALEASVNTPTTGLLARVSTIETAYVAADSALALRTSTLESQVQTPTTGLLARVSTIETAYVSADSALASRATTLEAQMANTSSSGLQSRIASEETARASADSALSSRTTTLESQVQTPTTGLLARVSTVESTKVDASGAYAQANSAISAALGGGGSITSAISASVSSEASARATADGYLAGKHVLKVAAGNVVTGMNITSSTGGGTDVSDIVFQATSFKVYNGSTGLAPFQIVGSKIRFTGNVEVDGSLVVAGTLSLTNLADRSLANLDSTANTKLAGIDAGADVTLSEINGGLNVTGGGITLSGGGAIKGGASNFSTGTGFFLGYEGGQYKFRVGDPAGARIQWDGSTWTVVNFMPASASVGTASIGSTGVSGNSYSSVGLSLSKSVAGSAAQITLKVSCSNNTSSSDTLNVRLKRGASVINTIYISLTSLGSGDGTMQFTDSPGSGTYTYSVEACGDDPGSSITINSAELTIIG